MIQSALVTPFTSQGGIKRCALALAVGLSLIGCGGGSGSDSGTTTQFKGKAIDGYLIGATVFLDVNFNGVLDGGEPTAVTQQEGDFELFVSGENQRCADYVPLVVDVPVGAIDSDFPDTPIEEAYSMVFPPQFAMSNDQDLLNLTPLTTVVWTQVEQELREQHAQSLSCASIIADQELRADIQQRLVEQELRVARRYNVTIDQLYGDYIEAGDDALHQLAQELVPGLQRSYAETRQLIDEHPEADIAWVEYFLGQWDFNQQQYDDHWYRYQFVQTSNGNYQSHTHLMSDDLQQQVSLYDRHSMTTEQRAGVNIEKTVSLEASQQAGQYYCSVSEWLETIAQHSSGVRNTQYGDAPDWQTCVSNTTAQHFNQALVTKNYQGEQLLSYTEHTYYEGNDSGFTHLIGVSDVVTVEDLTPVRDVIDADFYSEAGHGADYWARMRNQFSDHPSEPAQILTFHNSDGYWDRMTIYHNGTHLLECGSSEQDLAAENCRP